MTTNQEEEGETIEFYKIQVMEKDREISDFEAKIKKIQFKHNREIKEAKTGEERAKTILKDEKNKVDKLSKQAKQNQQQNNILQMRLNELKEAKQKEVLQIRAQYNSIKQQIRSYEKILPTHTFLIEINKSINQLPAYEDIFMNLKDKTAQLQQLDKTFEVFKSKNQEDINELSKNEQNLKNKKIEAEFSLKEVLSKVIDYEHTINDLKILSDEYQTRLSQLNDLLVLQKSRNSQLQENFKQYETKIQQLEHQFAHEMQSKQIDIRAQFKEEFQRLQHENNGLESRLELKESSYMNQISIYQEQINILQNKLHIEKEKSQEQLNQTREAYTQLKKQLNKKTKQADDMSHKNQELVDNLKQVSLSNEELQENIKKMKKKQQQFLSTSIEKLQNNEKKSQKLIQDSQKHHDQLQLEITKLKQALLSATEEKQGLEEELNQLRNQVRSKRASFSETKLMGSLDIPSSSELQYFQKYRRKSMESGYEEEIQVHFQQKKDANKQIKKAEQSSEVLNLGLNSEILKGQLYDFKTTIQLLQSKWQKSQELYKQKQQIYIVLQQTLDLLQNEKKSLLEQLSSQSQKIASLSSENSKLSQYNSSILSQKQTIIQNKSHQIMLKQNIQSSYKDELSKLLQQIQMTKMKNESLSKANSELQSNNQSLHKKIELYKTKGQSHQQQIKLLTEQSKKDKQMIKTQREQLKHQKQLLNSNGDKQIKNLKDIQEQIQILKEQKQRLRTQFNSKQKKLLLDIDRLNNNLVLEQKLKQQIKSLNNQIKAADDQTASLKEQLQDSLKEKQQYKKQIQLLEQENKNKDRQNQVISGSLDRQRRQRTLRSVPSLQSLNSQLQLAQEETFNDIYLTVTKKEGEINILQRQISDLKEQCESIKLFHNSKIQAIEVEHHQYIQTIIEMKMKCAQSQMKASEKQYLYSKLKKKMETITGGKI